MADPRGANPKPTKNTRMKTYLMLMTVGALPVHAAVVSWNKDAYGTIPESATDTAGVLAASWWNNSWPDGDQDTVDLQDDANSPTTIDLSLVEPSVYQIQNSDPGLDGDGSHNKRLLNGYMNAGTGQGGGVSSIGISQIPYASYDIYVYFSSDVAGREGSISDGLTTYFFSTAGPSSIAGADAVFLQALDTVDDATDPAANYAVFRNLSGASQTVTADIPGFGGIAGIQIAEVPEPSVALLGGLGALSLLRRRRR